VPNKFTFDRVSFHSFSICRTRQSTKVKKQEKVDSDEDDAPLSSKRKTPARASKAKKEEVPDDDEESEEDDSDDEKPLSKKGSVSDSLCFYCSTSQRKLNENKCFPWFSGAQAGCQKGTGSYQGYPGQARYACRQEGQN
jgi:hypothetical protein